MSAEQPSNTEGKADVQMDTGSSAKGKGKAAEPNDAMSEDDSENSEEEVFVHPRKFSYTCIADLTTGRG